MLARSLLFYKNLGGFFGPLGLFRRFGLGGVSISNFRFSISDWAKAGTGTWAAEPVCDFRFPIADCRPRRGKFATPTGQVCDPNGAGFRLGRERRFRHNGLTCPDLKIVGYVWLSEQARTRATLRRSRS